MQLCILDHIPLKEGLGEPPSVPPEGGKVSVAAGTRLWHIRLRGCCKINYLLSRRTAQGCRPYISRADHAARRVPTTWFIPWLPPEFDEI